MDWEIVKRELEAAQHARRDGNEGRARVCARRAAGWAVLNRRRARHEDTDEQNALRALMWLAHQEDTPEALAAAARRLTTRIRPDYSLPFEQDPLEDARAIVQAMAAESDG